MGTISPGDTRFPQEQGAPEYTLHRVACTHALSGTGRNATSPHRRTGRDSLVELVFPVRMLLNRLSIPLPRRCPCIDGPWEGILSRWVGERALLFILWILTCVTETTSFFQLAARKPRGLSVAHRSPVGSWSTACALTLLLTSSGENLLFCVSFGTLLQILLGPT